MFVFLFELLIIEEKTMICRDIYFSYIIGLMYFMNQHLQFIDCVSATVCNFFGCRSMTFVVNGVVHHIYQWMLENFPILNLIVFSHFIIIHTDCSGSVSIHLLCSFGGSVEYPIVYTHILLSVHFAIQT